MTHDRFRQIVAEYRRLRVAVVGDVCLDRYLHIDPAIRETSLETHLPVHKVVAVRPQPGGAGTVAANVAALRPARLAVLGVCGDDGEGFELRRALAAMGADLEHFITSGRRMTFTYTKPLLMHPGRPPEELSRLDIRSREPMDPSLEDEVIAGLGATVAGADVIIALDQVPQPGTGVLSRRVKDALGELARRHAEKVFLADSRCAIGEFSGVCVKVNRAELVARFGAPPDADPRDLARRWSGQLRRDIFVTLGEQGILAASGGQVWHVPAVPVEPPIDIVGAGDAVSASIAMALGAGATPFEAAEVGALAGSVVVKKIGTTGSASVEELSAALARASAGCWKDLKE